MPKFSKLLKLPSLKHFNNSIPSIRRELATSINRHTQDLTYWADQAVENWGDTIDHVDKLDVVVDQLIDTVDFFLSRIKYYVLFDTSSVTALEAERWLSDNASDDYDFFEVCNVAGVVINNETDYTMFKLHFGVVE